MSLDENKDPFKDEPSSSSSSIVFDINSEYNNTDINNNSNNNNINNNNNNNNNNDISGTTTTRPSTAHFKSLHDNENPFTDDHVLGGDDEAALLSTNLLPQSHHQDKNSSTFQSNAKAESTFIEHPIVGENSHDVDFHRAPIGKLKGMKLLYFTSAFVSLGVFVFGYDQGVMSGIITERSFVQYFDDPTKSQIGTVVAILEIGALCSSLSVGKLGDVLGRKKTILLGAVIFVIGGLLQCLSNGMWLLILGRVVSGISIGILSATVPMYQTEISPPSSRGRLGCIQFSGNICGYMASVWVDYSCSFSNNQTSWRLPLFLQSLLGFVLFIGGFFIVESPRWLLEKDKDSQGFHVLNLLFADSPAGTAENEYNIIKNSILEDRISSPPHTRTYKIMFQKYWYRVMIACTALMWAQLNGINVICYYAPMLFEAAGFNNEQALLVTGLNSIVYLLATIPPWFLVDKWGRKPILMSGGFLMGVSLLIIAFAEFLNKPASHVIVAIFVVIYMALFAMSWGPIPWLMCEILPLQVRAKGASLSTATNWIFNYLVGQMTPILLEKIKYRLYVIHGAFCLLSVVFVWRLFPETRGVELEDMDKLFNDNYTPVDGDGDGTRQEDEDLELHEFTRI